MGGAASWRAGGGPPGMCPMLAAAHCQLERAGELFWGPGWHVPNACWTSVSWPVGSIYAARSTAAPGMPPSPTSQPSSLPWLPTHPQVLDAPALADDYYLNLVDWSAQNTLAVGLGTCVYLWSACTSKVTRLVDFGEGGAVCRCGAGGLGGSKGSVWGGRHRVQVAGVCIRSCEQGVMEGSWLRVSKRACATCLCELFPPACPAACLGASAARTCPSVPTRGRCRSGTPPSASGEGAHVWHGRAGWKGQRGGDRAGGFGSWHAVARPVYPHSAPPSVPPVTACAGYARCRGTSSAWGAWRGTTTPWPRAAGTAPSCCGTCAARSHMWPSWRGTGQRCVRGCVEQGCWGRKGCWGRTTRLSSCWPPAATLMPDCSSCSTCPPALLSPPHPPGVRPAVVTRRPRAGQRRQRQPAVCVAPAGGGPLPATSVWPLSSKLAGRACLHAKPAKNVGTGAARAT